VVRRSRRSRNYIRVLVLVGTQAPFIAQCNTSSGLMQHICLSSDTLNELHL
jgi:hypothetical protein